MKLDRKKRAPAVGQATWCLVIGASLMSWLCVSRQIEAQESPRTGIDGQLTDTTSNEGIIEGTVEVIGYDEVATTDDDGHFSLYLAPGTYVLRATCPLYHSTRIERVRVGARRGELTVNLEPDLDSIIEIAPVTARGDTATEATQLQVRRRSAAVQDVVSAEEMSRSPDGSAGDSVRRVVAASLIDGQFLLVR